MSAYHMYGTAMNDRAALVRALHAESGGKWNAQVYEKPVKLKDFEGKTRPDTAEVVVPRSQVGRLANDIGFKRDENGNFVAVVSEYDREQGFNDEWLNRVQRRHAEETVLAGLRARGYTTVEREELKGADGQTRVAIRVKTPRSELDRITNTRLGR